MAFLTYQMPEGVKSTRRMHLVGRQRNADPTGALIFNQFGRHRQRTSSGAHVMTDLFGTALRDHRGTVRLEIIQSR
jgi:hypothetical protein